MFIFQAVLIVALLLSLYVVYRALMQSQTRATRVFANVVGAVFAVLACVFVLVVRPMVFDSAIIVSDSMQPTLKLNERIFSNKLAYRSQSPGFLEIITFKFPSRTPGAPEDIMVKRVIGLPGDTIEIREGAVLRNGERLDEPYIREPVEYTLPAVTVPQGKLWVMGDNRNESDDSHIWGFLDRSRVIGRVAVRFYPLSRAGSVH